MPHKIPFKVSEANPQAQLSGGLLGVSEGEYSADRATNGVADAESG